jgi:dephospho-CoA kinase
MKKVGLTGNIGCGKSTVARIFETLGIPVFHADGVAKEILTHKRTQIEIREKFGSAVFTSEGLDRKKLASIVFNDSEALTFLNSLIHPGVRKEFNLWFERQSGHPYVIEEAAILFETGIYKEFDKIITVVSPVDLAISRVMQRDSISREEVEKRMRNQWPQDKKVDLSSFVISNDENHLVIPQVLAIHDELCLAVGQ